MLVHSPPTVDQVYGVATQFAAGGGGGGVVTVTVAVSARGPTAAMIRVLPAFTPVTVPVEATVAMASSTPRQTIVNERPDGCAVADSDVVLPTSTDAVLGDTATLVPRDSRADRDASGPESGHSSARTD